MTNALGVDVSYHQSRIDWSKMRPGGAQFVFIRASYALLADTEFTRNWSESKSNMLLRGAYHYYVESADPIAQAEFFMRVVGSDHGELPLVVDVEDTSVARLTPQRLLLMLRKLEDLSGRKPIIYTGAWYWTHLRMGGPVSWANQYDLWAANYTTGAAPVIPTDWTAWKFWQYSDKGKGPQYGAGSTFIDQNRFNGNIEELVAYAGTVTQAPKIVIEKSQPVLPFSFFLKGIVPLYKMVGAVMVFSRNLATNWQIDVVSLATIGGETYWKVIDKGIESEYMLALQLCG